jgi:hypothetical protein
LERIDKNMYKLNEIKEDRRKVNAEFELGEFHCFILVTVYSIRGTNIPQFSLDDRHRTYITSPTYKQLQHSKTQQQATEIHTNIIPRTRTQYTTYRHQLGLTGYFHGHIMIILDHGKDVYHYLE